LQINGDFSKINGESKNQFGDGGDGGEGNGSDEMEKEQLKIAKDTSEAVVDTNIQEKTPDKVVSEPPSVEQSHISNLENEK